jgi:hypothetical protein
LIFLHRFALMCSCNNMRAPTDATPRIGSLPRV